MKNYDEKIGAGATLMVSKLLMQSAVDELKLDGKTYRFKGKMHLNGLERVLCDELTQYYKKVNAIGGEDAQIGLQVVWQSYEDLISLFGTLRVNDFERLKFLLPLLLKVPRDRFTAILSLITAYNANEVVEVSDEKYNELFNVNQL